MNRLLANLMLIVLVTPIYAADDPIAEAEKDHEKRLAQIEEDRQAAIERANKEALEAKEQATEDLIQSYQEIMAKAVQEKDFTLAAKIGSKIEKLKSNQEDEPEVQEHKVVEALKNKKWKISVWGDDRYRVYINGSRNPVTSGTLNQGMPKVLEYDASQTIKMVVVKVTNVGAKGGCALSIRKPDGQIIATGRGEYPDKPTYNLVYYVDNGELKMPTLVDDPRPNFENARRETGAGVVWDQDHGKETLTFVAHIR